MKKILTALITAMVISATPLAMSGTANAQWGYRGFHRGWGGYGGWGYRGLGVGYRGLGWGYGGYGYGYGGGNGGYGYGYGAYGYGYGGYGCGNCGYVGYAVPVVVAAPTVYYPAVVNYGYFGCGC